MVNERRTVLIVEDEPNLAQVLSEYFLQAGFFYYHIDNGADVLLWVKENQPDIIVLDLLLPERDGIDIYKELRTFSNIPVIMATARIGEAERLLGLDLGVDDYICKPYSPREVVARVKNVLRRTEAGPSEEPQGCQLQVESASMIVRINGDLVDLTPAEFRLLDFLYKNNELVFSRKQLMEHIYNDQRVVTDRSIDSHVKNVRKKLQLVEPNFEFIKSIYGVGYKLSLD